MQHQYPAGRFITWVIEDDPRCREGSNPRPRFLINFHVIARHGRRSELLSCRVAWYSLISFHGGRIHTGRKGGTLNFTACTHANFHECICNSKYSTPGWDSARENGICKFAHRSHREQIFYFSFFPFCRRCSRYTRT